MRDRDAPRGWRVGAPWGVPLYVSGSWPIFAAFIILYFGPQMAGAIPGIGTVGAYAVAALYAVLLAVSVLAHEAAHAVAARLLGARVGRVVLDVFGGHTTYESAGLTPGRSAIIAVVGPLANGVLAVLGSLVLPHLPPGVPWLVGTAFVLTNAVVGAFNLVPGHPLDGGHLLDAVIWKVTGRRDLGMIASGWAGRLIVVALVGWFVLVPFFEGRQPSFVMLAWAGLVGAMMWAGASQAVAAGRRLGAYSRVSLDDVLAPAIVVDPHTPMREVRRLAVADVGADRPGDEARVPGAYVLVPAPHGSATSADWDLVTVPQEVDTASLADAPASAFTVRPPRGWILDAGHHPRLEHVIDHMHVSTVPIVLLRNGDRPIGVVTAEAVNEALTRAGAF